MQFSYKAKSSLDKEVEGTIEADSKTTAREILEKRGLVIQKVKKVGKGVKDIEFKLPFLDDVSHKEVVMLSRQIATLFGAQVSALRVFQLLGSEVENEALGDILKTVVADLQGGTPIHKALAKHPKVFGSFYTNMVAAGEESGRLSETFAYLADYLERNYELSSKAKNALIYPSFVIATFIAVMILMLTYIIPKIGVILTESGQELPTYTKIVLGASGFLVNYGIFILVLLIILIGLAVWYLRKPEGKELYNHLVIDMPYVGNLYRKISLSRFSDNMNTMLSAGIPMVRALEVTASVMGNATYEEILLKVVDKVKAGTALSDALSDHPKYIPPILSQMVKVGEETGKIGEILQTLSVFYTREVNNAVDTLVGLIEPAMIVMLGLGVGTLLASVLLPIYNVSTGI